MCIARAKTAEPIELPFRVVSGEAQRNRVLDGRHLANTVKRLCAAVIVSLATIRGGNAASSQITLGCSLSYSKYKLEPKYANIARV